MRARVERSAQGELGRDGAWADSAGSARRGGNASNPLTSQIVNKLLHLPTVRMKEAAAGPTGRVRRAVRHLFGLGGAEAKRPRCLPESSRGNGFRRRSRQSASVFRADTSRPQQGSRSARPSSPQRRCAGPEWRSRSSRSPPPGDGDRTRPPGGIGTRGVFVKELEEALLAGRIDVAVHSAKDMTSTDTEGLVVGAYLQREDPTTRFCGAAGDRWACGWGRCRCGARCSCWPWSRRSRIERSRGNIDTRLRKRGERGLDAIVLAACGLDRLASRARSGIASPEELLPEAGQGALALQVRAGEEELVAAGRRSRRTRRPRRGGAGVCVSRSAAAALRRSRHTTTGRRPWLVAAGEDGPWVEPQRRRSRSSRGEPHRAERESRHSSGNPRVKKSPLARTAGDPANPLGWLGCIRRESAMRVVVTRAREDAGGSPNGWRRSRAMTSVDLRSADRDRVDRPARGRRLRLRLGDRHQPQRRTGALTAHSRPRTAGRGDRAGNRGGASRGRNRTAARPRDLHAGGAPGRASAPRGPRALRRRRGRAPLARRRARSRLGFCCIEPRSSHRRPKFPDSGTSSFRPRRAYTAPSGSPRRWSRSARRRRPQLAKEELRSLPRRTLTTSTVRVAATACVLEVTSAVLSRSWRVRHLPDRLRAHRTTSSAPATA